MGSPSSEGSVGLRGTKLEPLRSRCQSCWGFVPILLLSRVSEGTLVDCRLSCPESSHDPQVQVPRCLNALGEMEQLPSLAAPGQPVSLGPRKTDSSWHCLTTERTAMVQVGSGPLGLLLTGRLTSWHLAQGFGSHSCEANLAV